MENLPPCCGSRGLFSRAQRGWAPSSVTITWLTMRAAGVARQRMTRRIYEIVPIRPCCASSCGGACGCCGGTGAAHCSYGGGRSRPCRAPQPPRQPRLRRCLMMPRRLVMFGWDGSWSGSAGVPLLPRAFGPTTHAKRPRAAYSARYKKSMRQMFGLAYSGRVRPITRLCSNYKNINRA